LTENQKGLQFIGYTIKCEILTEPCTLVEPNKTVAMLRNKASCFQDIGWPVLDKITLSVQTSFTEVMDPSVVNNSVQH
jgi:hypothetical protein